MQSTNIIFFRPLLFFIVADIFNLIHLSHFPYHNTFFDLTGILDPTFNHGPLTYTPVKLAILWLRPITRVFISIFIESNSSCVRAVYEIGQLCKQDKIVGIMRLYIILYSLAVISASAALVWACIYLDENHSLPVWSFLFAEIEVNVII